MSDRSTHQSGPRSRKFVPDGGTLESRVHLSLAVSFPDGSSFIFPTFPQLPRTGGTMLQSGTALTVGVGQRTRNTVHLSGQGGGAGSVEWNGRAPHLFTGVQAILVQAASSRRDLITIHLSSTTTVASASASDMGSSPQGSHLVHALRSPRTSGTAIQTGTVLTFTDTSRKITELAISNFGQRVQLEWRGSAMPSFTGVSTIIVNISNGMKDFVALDNL